MKSRTRRPLCSALASLAHSRTRNAFLTFLCTGHWDGATKDSNQRWLPDGSGHLAAASCNLCLAVGKTQVEIDACSSDNTWAFPQPGNTGPITQKSSGLCLQPEAGKDGGRLTTVKCSASEPLQQWTIEVAGKSPPPPPPPPTRAGTTETFESVPDEGIFGFGEHQQGRLNNKGVTYDMESCLEYGKSHGGEVCLPYILCTNVNASRVSGYGFLWNMPNYVSRSRILTLVRVFSRS